MGKRAVILIPVGRVHRLINMYACILILVYAHMQIHVRMLVSISEYIYYMPHSLSLYIIHIDFELNKPGDTSV